MFDIFAKFIVRLNYLRLTNIDIPKNLEVFYRVLTNGFDINVAGQTEYVDELSDQEQKKSLLDRILRIDPSDYSPPGKFKKFRFSTLALKSALPLIVYPLIFYAVGLILVIIKKKYSNKFVDKKTSKFVYFWKPASKIWIPFYFFVEWLSSILVWNFLLKNTIFIFSPLSIGIYLDLFNNPRSNLVEYISLLISIFLIVLTIIATVGYFSLFSSIVSKKITLRYQEVQIFNNLKDNSGRIIPLFMTFKIIILINILSLIVVGLNQKPIICLFLFTALTFIEFVLSIIVRPFFRIRDNTKLILDGLFLMLIHLAYIPLLFNLPQVLKEIFGYFIIILVFLACLQGFVFRMAGYKGV